MSATATISPQSPPPRTAIKKFQQGGDSKTTWYTPPTCSAIEVSKGTQKSRAHYLIERQKYFNSQKTSRSWIEGKKCDGAVDDHSTYALLVGLQESQYDTSRKNLRDALKTDPLFNQSGIDSNFYIKTYETNIDEAVQRYKNLRLSSQGTIDIAAAIAKEFGIDKNFFSDLCTYI